MVMELYPWPFLPISRRKGTFRKKHFLETATATCNMFYSDLLFLKAHYSDFLLIFFFFAKADFPLICGLSTHQSSLVPL
jgi:hypothetical protein